MRHSWLMKFGDLCLNQLVSTLHIALRKRLARPPCDWPTVHRTYECLKPPRYTCGRVFKLAITYKWLQTYLQYKWFGQPLFLYTEIQAVVHTRWRVSTRCDLTCQHRRPDRVRNTTNATYIRRQHRSPKKLDGRLILHF